MNNRRKIIIYASIVFASLLILVIGASYAYFSVQTTNSFGSKTISASAPEIGSVRLVGDNNNIALNLSAEDMMTSNCRGDYFGTPNGTATKNETNVQLAHTEVTGEGYYNCSYTIQATATGTNNLYTAFQGWNRKSQDQIGLTVGREVYDFNDANLFPITINGTMNGVSSGNSRVINASLKFANECQSNQDVLKNKDITISLTVTDFSCSIAKEPMYYVYDSNNEENGISAPLTSNAGLTYYLKGYSDGSYDEVCGVFSGTEYCMRLDGQIMPSFKADMEALGLTCSSESDYHMFGSFDCWDDTTICGITGSDYKRCGSLTDYEECSLYGFENRGGACSTS